MFPLAGTYTPYPLDLQATAVDQWNVSYQRQVAADWMVSANYIGSLTKHLWVTDQINPAVYIPGASTVANTQARRELNLQNAAEGQVLRQRPAGRLTTARRATTGCCCLCSGAVATACRYRRNYTISRCISDRWNSEPGVAGVPLMIPGNMAADRGKCANSPEHSLNTSVVYQIPPAGSGKVAAVTGGWQVSGILSARSGSYITVTTGVDQARTGLATNQRANQILDDPFMPDRTFSQWLNPAAFQLPALGTYGTMPLDAMLGPGRLNVDTGVSRSFRLGMQADAVPVGGLQRLQYDDPGQPGLGDEQPGLREGDFTGGGNISAHYAVRGEVYVLGFFFPCDSSRAALRTSGAASPVMPSVDQRHPLRRVRPAVRFRTSLRRRS